MKIKYARGSYFRKPKYRTFTRIEEVNGRLVVRKFPVTKAASPHVQSFYEKTFIVEDALGLKTPKVLEKSEKYFIYEYLSFPTIEQLIEKAVISQNFSQALQLVEKFFSIIDSLPSLEKKIYEDQEFGQVFDPNNQFSTYKKELCIIPGLIDVNADNLLVNDAGEYLLIDYEWLYKFPIPKQFIQFRSIYYLAVHLQSIIQTMCSPLFSCTNVIEGVHIPTSWLKLVTNDKNSIYRFLSYEINFQNSVLLLTLPRLKMSDIRLDEAVKITSTAHAEEFKLKKENKELKGYIHELEDALNEVKDSKFYKASKLIKRLKRVNR